MPEWLQIVLFVAVWVGLQRWILPRFGVPRAGTEKGCIRQACRLAIVIVLAIGSQPSAFGETVCELLGQVSSRKGKTVQVSGVYSVGDPDNALFSQLECARPPRTDSFVWASGVVLVFPKDKAGEDVFPGPAGKAFEEGKREGGRFQLMVRGILRTKPAYFVGTDAKTGQPLPQGFGESKGYYAELLVNQIVFVRKVD
jgi:hypothetical protein